MSAKPERRQGPRRYRIAIFLLSSLLTLLFIWLLGFLVKDIGSMPGPDYDEIEEQFVDSAMKDELEEKNDQSAATARQIQNQIQIQGILRTSTDSSQATMNQLTEQHRLSLEQGVTPSEAEQAALAESQRLFLDNQRRFQEANELISALSAEQRNLKEDIRVLNERIEEARKPAREEFKRQRDVHQLKVASLKLAFLVPLLIVTAVVVVKKRASAYAPIAYPAFLSTFWMVAVVMRRHFPSELFKYIAIASGIGVVLAFLIFLIRNLTAPKADWLLRQYREAYNRRLCPICSNPILRGPMRHMTWSSKGPIGTAPPPREGATDDNEPYTCPACGTALFEKCERCEATRHSLLPFCESCGHEKAIGQESGAEPREAPA